MSLSIKGTEVYEESPLTPLPPVISNNPRTNIYPQQVEASKILSPHKKEKPLPTSAVQLVTSPAIDLHPCPRYPLTLIWSPDQLYFELNDKPIINKLLLWNGCSRLIYVHCCGLWNEKARLGASWCCYPRTRIHLAPGLNTVLYVRATPRGNPAPIPRALMWLQLAASHKRDNVTGYFSVPIIANFLKYQKPCLGEE